MSKMILMLLVLVSCGALGAPVWVVGKDLKTGLPINVNIGDIELNELDNNDVPTLINGRPATAGEFPATVYASMSGARCTGNVVGPRAMIIAAHCVGNGKTASFAIDGQNYDSTCTHSPDYAGNETSDWALCEVSKDVSGIEFESLNIDTNFPKVGDKITLTGFGCVNPGGGGGNDGILRVGESTVKRMPSGSRDNDIVTQGGAALCFGDSGGPAYSEINGKRYQVSVNSRGDIRTTSYLSALAVPQFTSFVTNWLSVHKAVKICGIGGYQTGCRGGGSAPENPLPVWCPEKFEFFRLCLFGNPRQAPSKTQDCRDAYADLFACEESAEQPLTEF